MDFLKNIKKETLLITDNSLKNKILESINSLNTLVNVKMMSKEEFIKRYYFDYDERTIYYVKNKYNLSVKNAVMYLNNMKYIIDLNIENKKVTYLKNMYLDLLNNNLLILDNLFKEYLKNIDIIVLNKDTIEPFYLRLFDLYDAKYIDIEKEEYNLEYVNHFKTIEEECSFIFNEISALIKKGVSYKDIKLTNVKSEYIPFLKRFSKLYNIKINNLEKISIYATVATNKLIKMLEENTKEEVLDYITSNLDKEIFLSFLNIINKYYFTNDLKLVLDLIKEDLKNTNLNNINYEESVEVIPLNSYLVKDEYVFLMGFNLENIPTTYKDIDYLDDNLCPQIGLFTSAMKNKLESKKVISDLKNIKNLIITYKDTDPYKSYYPANLIEDLNLKIIDNQASVNTTSNLYNKIKLVDNFDNMLKYGTRKSDTKILLNTYKDINYLSYNNKFKGLNNFKLDRINLSYTSLDNYYHCAFRYYIDSILKLNIYEDTFKIYIGNLFHFVLSKIFEDEFDFEFEYNNYLKTREFTKKEKFYLKILKEELKSIIEIVKYHHSLSGLIKVKLETEIKLKYQDNHIFKGIIDKIMYKEKDGNTYLSLIDYKTGTPKLDMTNLIYGLDMQLPIYVHLVKKSNLFLNPKIIGFYLQQIVHEKGSYDPKKDLESIKKDKLKLNGYSINDDYLINMFDASYLNSEMIKGMKITSKGFSHYTKVLESEAIDNLVNIVDLKIKEAFKEIENANFAINPKVVDGKNIGCNFCKYKDLCFKTGSDLVYLEKKRDLSYLGGCEDAKLD